jgi:hypothetical protein
MIVDRVRHMKDQHCRVPEQRKSPPSDLGLGAQNGRTEREQRQCRLWTFQSHEKAGRGSLVCENNVVFAVIDIMYLLFVES